MSASPNILLRVGKNAEINVSLPNIESYSNIYNLEQYSGIMLSYFDSAKFAIVPYWR